MPGRPTGSRRTRAASPPGACAFAARSTGSGFGDGTVARIDPATNRVVARVQVGGQPYGITAGADSVWVGNNESENVTRVEVATNRVVSRIAVGDRPIGLTYDDGSVWVANFGDGALTRIDAATNAVTGRTVFPGDHEGVVAAFGAVWVPSEPGSL